MKEKRNYLFKGADIHVDKDGHSYAVDKDGNIIGTEGVSYLLPEVTIKPKVNTPWGAALLTSIRNPNWRDTYDMSPNLETLNAVTAGILNWGTSPTTTARILWDASLGDFNKSAKGIVYGNNGVVSDNFAAKHPWATLGINLTGDIVSPFAYAKATKLAPRVGKEVVNEFRRLALLNQKKPVLGLNLGFRNTADEFSDITNKILNNTASKNDLEILLHPSFRERLIKEYANNPLIKDLLEKNLNRLKGQDSKFVYFDNTVKGTSNKNYSIKPKDLNFNKLEEDYKKAFDEIINKHNMSVKFNNTIKSENTHKPINDTTPEPTSTTEIPETTPKVTTTEIPETTPKVTTSEPTSTTEITETTPNVTTPETTVTPTNNVTTPEVTPKPVSTETAANKAVESVDDVLNEDLMYDLPNGKPVTINKGTKIIKEGDELFVKDNFGNKIKLTKKTYSNSGPDYRIAEGYQKGVSPQMANKLLDPEKHDYLTIKGNNDGTFTFGYKPVNKFYPLYTTSNTPGKVSQLWNRVLKTPTETKPGVYPEFNSTTNRLIFSEADMPARGGLLVPAGRQFSLPRTIGSALGLGYLIGGHKFINNYVLPTAKSAKDYYIGPSGKGTPGWNKDIITLEGMPMDTFHVGKDIFGVPNTKFSIKDGEYTQDSKGKYYLMYPLQEIDNTFTPKGLPVYGTLNSANKYLFPNEANETKNASSVYTPSNDTIVKSTSLPSVGEDSVTLKQTTSQKQATSQKLATPLKSPKTLLLKNQEIIDLMGFINKTNPLYKIINNLYYV